MAGVWHLSRVQLNDEETGIPLVGALAYFFEAGTSTPMTVYQDSGLALEHPHPLETDGFGQWPSVYFDDETFSFYRVRVTDSGGSERFDESAVPIIGQQTGEGGAETPIDPNAVFTTGDEKWRFGTGTLAGWVRENGRTIGSASSGATERANADCQDLFEYLWGAASDTILAVSGGRGASANADWTANKTITLPDSRHRAFFGVGSMGGSAAGLISADYIDTGGVDTVGSVGGVDDVALTTAELASHTHDFTTDTDGAHTHFVAGNVATSEGSPTLSAAERVARANSAADAPAYALNGTVAAATVGLTSSTTHNHHGTTDAAGTGEAHENMPPFTLRTVYIKL